MKTIGWGLLSVLTVALLSGCGGGAGLVSSESRLDYGPAEGNRESADPILGDRKDARSRAIAHTDLAAAYFEKGEMAIALEETRIALRIDDSYPPIYNLLGLIQMQLKDPAQARASFERALRLDSRDPDINHNFGRFLCQNGSETEGIRYFMNAVQNPLYKSPARSYGAAGACYQSLKRDDDAFDMYDRALKLDPNYQPALLPQATLLMRRGALDEASALLVRYNRLARPNMDSLWLTVRIAHRRGDAQTEKDASAALRRTYPDSEPVRAMDRGDFR